MEYNTDEKNYFEFNTKCLVCGQINKQGYTKDPSLQYDDQYGRFAKFITKNVDENQFEECSCTPGHRTAQRLVSFEKQVYFFDRE